MPKIKGLPSGSVYQRGNVYWLKYYVPGKREPVRLSSGTSDEEAAIALLRQKMARVALKQDHTSDPDRVKVSQLLDLLVDDYKYEDRSSAEDVELRVEKHLRPHFGHLAAKDVGTSELKRYVQMRRKTAAQATVNKELAFLRRAFRLGYRHEPKLVLSVPYFPIKAVDNAREGTVPEKAYKTLLDLLPPYARMALVISYNTGARKGEVRQIRLDRIDLEASRIELARKTTKGTTEKREGRYLPIYNDMAAELERYLPTVRNSGCPYLIQQNGEPVKSFYKAWKKACDAANIPAALFHDLRRTAVTNMIDWGFSETEVMSISGHRTRSVFERYNIKSKERTSRLAKRLDEAKRGSRGKKEGEDA